MLRIHTFQYKNGDEKRTFQIIPLVLPLKEVLKLRVVAKRYHLNKVGKGR